ncbi:Hsp70 family protein [Lentzea tibetensis]|uniref:Hsp70 family protein n=1 Tax=Lentzea tibetensis TaxID=2591470 RepID=A0A563EP18_9PSEU|nr:Hsp70 family protein [Lentzea tibetensis]TWP48838.1 Hsp70 family protein [Lentzea tibetensis]
MRDSIDFGIDLGTTNSAIAVVHDGEAQVIKNNDGWEYTPSAVWIPREGVTNVGRSARDRLHREMDNVHAEFKQEMGLEGAVRTFRKSGISLTPPQLSAEVLKSLRADAASRFGEPPRAAVITVPAAFRLHENNATSLAAELAGFGACPLVQEPTAAAFAYGFQNESADACWMVFDFGGGTFDAAVVSTHDGELRVLDHEGDPHLGGKLIDWAIVERVLAPAVAREFGLTDFTRDNPAWRLNFYRLKWAAEEAKISLSRNEKAVLYAEIDLGDGDTETFEYTLHRDEADRVAEPYYLRAINLCRAALSKANLHTGDIDRLLLVGGATLAPGLRERLADPVAGMGIELDHIQDPTTVVARGAAVFASTVPLAMPKVRPAAGEFSADLRYPLKTSLLTASVVGRVESAPPQDMTRFAIQLDNPDGMPPFRSAKVPLDAQGNFLVDVKLAEKTASTFTLLLVNDSGGTEKITPRSVKITHWPQEPGGQVLTNSIGLAEADRKFAPILRKGSRLPAKERATFYTTAALHRTDTTTFIKIPIVEGEQPVADRNLQVGLIEIWPKDVRIDLPQGSEVEVTIEVDESRRVTVVADVPLVDEQFEAEIDLTNVRARDTDDLERELTEVRRRIDELRDSAGRTGFRPALDKLDQIDGEQRVVLAETAVRAARSDAGSAAAADQRLRELQAELDGVEADVELPALREELDALIKRCRQLVDRLGNADDRTEFDEIARRASLARTADEIEAVLERAADLQTMLMKREGTFDIGLFFYFKENQHRMTSPARARALIGEGDRAIATEDFDALIGINQQLRQLWPADLQEPSAGVSSQRNGRGW